MSVLSAQSIRRLCFEEHGQYVERRGYGLHSLGPLVTPFVEKGTINGMSFGLSACTYDCRIAQDLVLEPMPFEAMVAYVRGGGAAEPLWKPWAALASTIEQFNIPIDVCGSVLDKSTFARVFITAFNTHLDPGWRRLPEVPGKENNHLTVELVNLGTEPVTYHRGDPVCQVKFEFLDEPTDLPYAGKFLGQPNRPIPALYYSDGDIASR